MGIVKLPRLHHYWSTATLFHGLWARSMIPTFARYKSVLAFLHVVDHRNEDPNDKIRKVRFLYDHFRERCKALFQPYQNIAIDERMVKSKARFSYKQFIKNKPVKFGFKIFALCDSHLRYLYNFKLYTGSSRAGQVDHGLAHNTVVELLTPLSGQGHKLFTDNFYTSPDLFIDLKENHNTVAAGTCQTNRHGFPVAMKNAKQFKQQSDRGAMRFVRTGSVLHLQWVDKRCVTVLSTMHSATSFIPVTRRVKVNHQLQELHVRKPRVIEDYNNGMGGVDQFDQDVAAYRVLRRTEKFWKTLFLDFIDVAVVNSFVLCKLYVAEHPGAIRLPRKFDHLEYRLTIIRQLAQLAPNAPVPLFRRSSPPAPPPQKHLPQFAGVRRECMVCKQPNQTAQKSIFACSECKNRQGHPRHFCVTADRNCFETYHRQI